jgi:capsid protein
MISPHIFQKKKESRFKFAHQVAHSVDPWQANQKIIEDEDEIQVPKKIQDLIERGIRTLSHSLSTVKSNVNDIKSTAAQEAQEERATGIKITTLNRMLQQEQNKEAEAQLLEIKELKERWYTKMELKMQERQGGQPPAGATTAQ